MTVNAHESRKLDDDTLSREWRLQCIKVSQDMQSLLDGEIYKSGEENVSVTLIKYPGQEYKQFIPIPNPSATYLSLSYQAKEKANKLFLELNEDFHINNNMESFPKEKEAYLFDGVEQLISCIIFSYTAIEAFANESIPEDYHFEQIRKDKKCKEIYSKDQIERYIKLDTKLDEILPEVFSLPSPKGGLLWSNFIWLEELRDRFIHLKRTDWGEFSFNESGGINNIWNTLFSKEALKAPIFALELIKYYHPKNKPRWLRMIPIKYSE